MSWNPVWGLWQPHLVTPYLRVRCHRNGCWACWYQFSKGKEIQDSCREIKYIKIIQENNIARAPFQIVWKNFGWAVVQDGHSQDHSMHWGISTLFPLKNITPFFLPSPPLNLQTVQAPFYRQSPLEIVFSWQPP